MERQNNKIDKRALNEGIDRVLRYDTATKAVRKPQKETRAEVLLRALKLRGNTDRQLSVA